ncbi:hypothetical protein DBV15_11045 [Temnothorax longispinosus]|uniref:Uncharacterized protein n=1 Tax=Temnothorax longispinosus TaxID=300112 RepID=A0A4S2KP61_9HYME|nr:hypothetical protein DBV15_11045 [Temnothorax longispinosus]
MPLGKSRRYSDGTRCREIINGNSNHHAVIMQANQTPVSITVTAKKKAFKTTGKHRDVKRRPTAAVSIELTSVRAVTSAGVDTATLCPLDVNSNVNISPTYATTRTRERSGRSIYPESWCAHKPSRLDNFELFRRDNFSITAELLASAESRRETVEICSRVVNSKKPLMLKLTNNFRVRHEEAAANFGWCMGKSQGRSMLDKNSRSQKRGELANGELINKRHCRQRERKRKRGTDNYSRIERLASCVIEYITPSVHYTMYACTSREIPLNPKPRDCLFSPPTKTCRATREGRRYYRTSAYCARNYSMQIALFPPHRITTDCNVFRRGIYAALPNNT